MKSGTEDPVGPRQERYRVIRLGTSIAPDADEAAVASRGCAVARHRTVIRVREYDDGSESSVDSLRNTGRASQA
jgi:hypothetical protein